MSAGEEKLAALVPIETTALSKAGAKSLLARGQADLRIREEKEKEEAVEWLRKGLELQNAAPADPRKKGPINPYANPPTGLAAQLQTTIPEYIKQISAGTSPDVAAESPRMSPEERMESLSKKYEEMHQEAFRCFEKGHDLDPRNPALLYWLAESYYNGDGVEWNEGKALPLYQRAAEQGHSDAQYMLSVYFRDGRGVKQDHAQALKLLHKAAEQGSTSAQYDLALAYKYGNLGVEQDAAQAMIWFKKIPYMHNNTVARGLVAEPDR